MFLSVCYYGQEEPTVIKVRKSHNLVKAVFDNTEYRLFAVDKFGNPKDNKIASYTLWIKEKKKVKSFQGYSNALTPEMLKELKKLKKATKIVFTGVKAETFETHFVDLPDIYDTWFPDCKNCLKK